MEAWMERLEEACGKVNETFEKEGQDVKLTGVESEGEYSILLCADGNIYPQLVVRKPEDDDTLICCYLKYAKPYDPESDRELSEKVDKTFDGVRDKLKFIRITQKGGNGALVSTHMDHVDNPNLLLMDMMTQVAGTVTVVSECYNLGLGVSAYFEDL